MNTEDLQNYFKWFNMQIMTFVAFTGKKNSCLSLSKAMEAQFKPLFLSISVQEDIFYVFDSILNNVIS